MPQTNIYPTVAADAVVYIAWSSGDASSPLHCTQSLLTILRRTTRGAPRQLYLCWISCHLWGHHVGFMLVNLLIWMKEVCIAYSSRAEEGSAGTTRDDVVSLDVLPSACRWLFRSRRLQVEGVSRSDSCRVISILMLPMTMKGTRAGSVIVKTSKFSNQPIALPLAEFTSSPAQTDFAFNALSGVRLSTI